MKVVLNLEKPGHAVDEVPPCPLPHQARAILHLCPMLGPLVLDHLRRGRGIFFPQQLESPV